MSVCVCLCLSVSQPQNLCARFLATNHTQGRAGRGASTLILRGWLLIQTMCRHVCRTIGKGKSVKQNCTYRLDSSYEEGSKELHHSPPKGITRTVSDDLKVSLQFLRIEKYVALSNDQPILILVYPVEVICIVVQ